MMEAVVQLSTSRGAILVRIVYSVSSRATTRTSPCRSLPVRPCCIVYGKAFVANGLCTEKQEETLAATAAVHTVPSDVKEEVGGGDDAEDPSMSKPASSSRGMMALSSACAGMSVLMYARQAVHKFKPGQQLVQSECNSTDCRRRDIVAKKL
uniref:Uncharacterized protein n=1 Tax=Peronospora matthiolae TaxID=2874970 RepID=A0AAV1TJV1_9STRA